MLLHPWGRALSSVEGGVVACDAWLKSNLSPGCKHKRAVDFRNLSGTVCAHVCVSYFF